MSNGVAAAHAYGLGALHPQIAEHGGVVKWAKANPGQAAILAGVEAVNVFTNPGISGESAQQFHSIIQPHQFGQTA